MATADVTTTDDGALESQQMEDAKMDKVSANCIPELHELS